MGNHQTNGSCNQIYGLEGFPGWISRKNKEHGYMKFWEEIRRSPVEVGSLTHYLRRVLPPSQVVGLGISEPSTVLGCPRKLATGWQVGYNPNIPHLYPFISRL